MAFDLLDDFPAVARTTLIELARRQGVRTHPRSEEQPGRILHEDRPPNHRAQDDLARYWDFPYFGAVDTTPQWINLLAAYSTLYGSDLLACQVVDRSGALVTLSDCAARAVGWLVARIHDGATPFVWVKRMDPHGHVRQSWMDSWDAYFHEDGTVLGLDQVYVPVEVQGNAYDALLAAADIFESCRPQIQLSWSTSDLRRYAAELRQRVLAAFWVPDLRTFALALSIEPRGQPRALRVVASNPGHLLASRLLDGADVAEQRTALVERLLSVDMLAGAGVRTKSTNAARFRAGSYHNGSTWPMDSGLIAEGLRHHGLAREADDLEQRLLDACRQVGAFPEFFRGDVDGNVSINTKTIDVVENGLNNRLEQVPQMRQGWTATRVWRILRQRGLIA